jgi:hypothetical protein
MGNRKNLPQHGILKPSPQFAMLKDFTEKNLRRRNTNGDYLKVYSDAIGVQMNDRNGNIYRIDIQNQSMNLAETREFGLKMLNMMGKDSAKFNNWCEVAGTRLTNQKNFTSAFAPFPNSQMLYGFEVLHAYQDEKPWYVLVVVTDPN